jgi:pyrroloquinoline quinone (PQQ) biosynthesis protein C
MLSPTTFPLPVVDEISSNEEKIIQELMLEKEFGNIVAKQGGLQRFAETFYFVRYDFCRLNFIVGERCCTNEFLWSGLAKNLYEEMGGKNGVSHNQLYRDFLLCAGAEKEGQLEEPGFAREFNQSWEAYCRKSPLAEVLSAIAIYEIFDVPDYQLLLRVMKKADVPQQGLKFFNVHAVSNHFEMFEDVMSWLRDQEGGEESFDKAKDFVFRTQTKMWRGLVEHLQK